MRPLCELSSTIKTTAEVFAFDHDDCFQMTRSSGFKLSLLAFFSSSAIISHFLWFLSFSAAGSA